MIYHRAYLIVIDSDEDVTSVLNPVVIEFFDGPMKTALESAKATGKARVIGGTLDHSYIDNEPISFPVGGV